MLKNHLVWFLDILSYFFYLNAFYYHFTNAFKKQHLISQGCVIVQEISIYLIAKMKLWSSTDFIKTKTLLKKKNTRARDCFRFKINERAKIQ